MKLGISYPVFEGEELLEFVLRPIRDQLDFVSVFYQNVSYFGNTAQPELILEPLVQEGLIDKLILFKPDLKVDSKVNELAIRNLGVEKSVKAGCTHHIAADVDEFYAPEQLYFSKNAFLEQDYDCSIVMNYTYFKEPTWHVTPPTKHVVSLIQPVRVLYQPNKAFPYPMERTRTPAKYDKFRIFNEDEFIIHHMSYVRRDIMKKLINSPTGKMYNLNYFKKMYDKYQLGERLCLAPEFRNRRTKLVENSFNINLE